MGDRGARAGATSSHLVRRGGVKSRRLRVASAQSCPAWPGERCRRRRHGWRDHPLLGRRAASQCRRHGQGEVGAGPRVSPCASQGGRQAGRQLPGYFRRRCGRCLRRWRSCRLDLTGQSPGIRSGDGRQHRRADRAVRLPRTSLRRCTEEGLHRVQPRATSPSPGRSEDCLVGSRSRATRLWQGWSPFTSTTASSKRWPPST